MERLMFHLGVTVKSYYETHEGAYRQIEANGNVGWGNAKTLDDMSDAQTKAFVGAVANKYFPEPNKLKALDLGCGSGPTSILLAKMGFEVTGVDISETALRLGRRLAAEQSLSIHFEQADVLHLETLGQKFDFVYDSHCLHCIVFDEDRLSTLNGVRQTLAPNGIFLLDTMVFTSGIDLTGGIESLRFDDDYILWHKTDTPGIHGVVNHQGQLWCAQRRVFPIEKVLAEVAASGFEVLSQTIDKQPAGNPDMLRLVLRPAL